MKGKHVHLDGLQGRTACGKVRAEGYSVSTDPLKVTCKGCRYTRRAYYRRGGASRSLEHIVQADRMAHVIEGPGGQTMATANGKTKRARRDDTKGPQEKTRTHLALELCVASGIMWAGTKALIFPVLQGGKGYPVPDTTVRTEDIAELVVARLSMPEGRLLLQNYAAECDARALGKTFAIIEAPEAAGGKAITCLRCNLTSYHREDVNNLWCASCNAEHAR